MVSYLGPKHSFTHEIARETLTFHDLLPITLFPKNIQSNFILILLFKEIEMTIGRLNNIRQYKINLKLIEEKAINSWYRADNSLDLNNLKKIVFYSSIEPHQF